MYNIFVVTYYVMTTVLDMSMQVLHERTTPVRLCIYSTSRL